MDYILDSNVFIQANRLHYSPDFCPAFWQWLLRENKAGKVFSIDMVRDEIMVGGDNLSDWAKASGKGFFLEPDEKMLPALRKVSQWASGQNYESAAVSTFLQLADYYLVAHALATGRTVVTHEQASTSTKKIKIPDACIGLKVKFMTPYQMLRIEKAKFELGPAGA